jgi:hypothetical protein
MKNLMMIVILFVMAAGCNGQKKQSEKVQQQIASADTLE